MVAYSNSFHTDNTWYVDIGANQHVASNSGNLHLTEPYQGNDKVAVANSNGLQIKHTGKLTLHIPKSTLYLKHVLHCPQAVANLLSINKFFINNNYFFVLTDSHYFIKDNLMGQTLLTEASKERLFPIPIDRVSIHKTRSNVVLMDIRTILDV